MAANGDLYIADTNNNRVRKVGAGDQVIDTVAGTGNFGDSGDGGAATAAGINQPVGLALDSAGRLLVAAFGGSRVRRVASGIIGTVAGTGVGGYNGDGIDAAQAELNYPWGLAVDSAGNIFVADQANSRLRVIGSWAWVATPTSTATVTPVLSPTITLTCTSSMTPTPTPTATRTQRPSPPIWRVAGTTNAGAIWSGYNGDGQAATAAYLSYPQGVVLDGNGGVYISDFMNERVRHVDAAGAISTVAGIGVSSYNGDGIPAVAAGIHDPGGMAMDSTGNLYFADAHNHRIRRIDAVTGLISTVAGTGSAGYNGDGMAGTAASLYFPRGITFGSDGSLYIADTFNGRVRRVDAATGLISTLAGNGTQGVGGDGGAATAAQLYQPYSVALDGAGNMYIGGSPARVVDAGGVINSMPFAGVGLRVRNGKLYYATGDTIGAMDLASGIYETVAGDGVSGYNGDGIEALSAHLSTPFDVDVDSQGRIFIADTSNQMIRVVCNVWPAATAMPSFTPALTRTPTATPTATATQSPAAGASFTPYPTASPSCEATPTPSPSASPNVLTPTVVHGSGAPKVLKVVAAPNPMMWEGMLGVDLEGCATSIEISAYTAGYVLAYRRTFVADACDQWVWFRPEFAAWPRGLNYITVKAAGPGGHGQGRGKIVRIF